MSSKPRQTSPLKAFLLSPCLASPSPRLFVHNCLFTRFQRHARVNVYLIIERLKFNCLQCRTSNDIPALHQTFAGLPVLIETLSAKPRHRMVLTHVLDILNDLVTPTNEGGRMVAEEYNTDCILQDKEVPVTWDFFFGTYVHSLRRALIRFFS